MITGNHLCAASLHWWQRFLAVRFLTSLLVSLVLVALAWIVVRKSLRKFGAPARARPL